MDEELEGVEEDQQPTAAPHNNEADPQYEDEEEEDDDCDDDDDDDDDGWGDFTVTNGALDTLREAILTNSNNEANEMLFVPEPVVSLLNDAKPAMPMLTQEELPPGTKVWIVDEDDVKLLLKDAWDPPIRIVCNGREIGTVQRHSGDLTLVSFSNESIGMSFAFTLPRPCLSIQPIVAYESNRPANRPNALASSFGVGNLGPRAGRGTARTKDEVNILQQYYEVMLASIVKCKNAQPTWEQFVKGKVQPSLAAINTLIAEAEGASLATPEGSPLLGSRASSISSNNNEGGAGNNAANLTLKELYCVRSMMRIFDHDANGALDDAQKAIKLNPSWVKGYLRAARAHQASGKFTLAGHMINQTLLLLPHSEEVLRLSDLNNYLCRVNAELEQAAPHIGIRLSCTYAKLLMPKRGFQVGEVIFEETEPVLSIPSMQNATQCCSVCLRTSSLSEMSIDASSRHHNDNNNNNSSHSPLTRPFCSAACQQRGTLFLPMELITHELGYRSASGLIYSKAASSMNMLPLEQARLTMRLFFIVCTTHARLQAQREQQHVQQAVQEQRPLDSVLKTFNGTCKESVVSVEEALQHLGIFPLVSINIDNKTRDDLTTLCNVLCQAFTAEEKTLYSPSLFLGLYAYVANHIVFAETPSDSASPGAVVKAYHLGKLNGGIDIVQEGGTPNCEVQVRQPGVMTVVATREIFKDDRLVRPALKTTQH